LPSPAVTAASNDRGIPIDEDLAGELVGVRRLILDVTVQVERRPVDDTDRGQTRV
jgi:hypothetical protein